MSGQRAIAARLWSTSNGTSDLDLATDESWSVSPLLVRSMPVGALRDPEFRRGVERIVLFEANDQVVD
jgi:hypothetical protein